MTKADLLHTAVVFYALPKLSVFLPLCWFAICLWWADRLAEKQGMASIEEPVEPVQEKQREHWYDHILTSTSTNRLPADWL